MTPDIDPWDYPENISPYPFKILISDPYPLFIDATVFSQSLKHRSILPSFSDKLTWVASVHNSLIKKYQFSIAALYDPKSENQAFQNTLSITFSSGVLNSFFINQGAIPPSLTKYCYLLNEMGFFVDRLSSANRHLLYLERHKTVETFPLILNFDSSDPSQAFLQTLRSPVSSFPDFRNRLDIAQIYFPEVIRTLHEFYEVPEPNVFLNLSPKS